MFTVEINFFTNDHVRWSAVKSTILGGQPSITYPILREF